MFVKLLRQGRNCSQAFAPCQLRLNRNRYCRPLLEIKQWSVTVRKVAGIQNLNAGLVVAIEVRSRGRAVSVAGFGCIREPEPQVIDLDWTSSRIDARVIRKHNWRGRDVRSLDKRLFAEDTCEVSDAPAIGVSTTSP